MTLEKRIVRAERVLKVFARRGRKYRNEFRENLNILIKCQIDTNEQLKKTDEQIEALVLAQARTDEALDRLTANQAKTDAALRRFINALRKDRNGNSEN